MNIVFLTLVLALAIASLNLKKSIASLISFALMMLILGIYYLYLDEKLLGLFQIFVYTGGISVLMLFGITLIGTSFPPSRKNPWTALLAFLFFAITVSLFYNNYQLLHVSTLNSVDNHFFTSSFSDYVLIFALIGSSLLYATIKMIRIINPKRRKDV